MTTNEIIIEASSLTQCPMTPNEIITEARRLIQDTKSPYRYSDEVMLGFVNQTLKRMAIIRPDLFAVVADFPTVAGAVLQSCPPDSVRLIEIFQVKNGNAVTEVNRAMLDRTTPGWQLETPGQPVNFMRHVRNPNRFFLYPAPKAGVVLVGEYAQTPPDYALDDEIVLPTCVYFPVIVDGVVFLAESIDDEHVNSNRAKMYQDLFMQSLDVAAQSRTITDTEAGGEDPKQVI